MILTIDSQRLLSRHVISSILQIFVQLILPVNHRNTLTWNLLCPHDALERLTNEGMLVSFAANFRLRFSVSCFSYCASCFLLLLFRILSLIKRRMPARSRLDRDLLLYIEVYEYFCYAYAVLIFARARPRESKHLEHTRNS